MIPNIPTMSLQDRIQWVTKKCLLKKCNLDPNKIHFILGSMLRINNEVEVPLFIKKLSIATKFEMVINDRPELFSLLMYWLEQWIIIIGDENVNDEYSWSWPSIPFFPNYKIPKVYRR